ncbi:methionine-R-sulfoxide reductase [Asticcacaulis biprosthecium C19]|uniref:Peptide methionine sulfoxide reductase MsrB n=1 Tax=Asticcacaulis biprosthecium C19 TaxID=715226 RepID=F4QLR2_9CAUL|nr:peptide-methionine (R)-S-oxide reductase MsrB [Asticcacaulis biprosthecium]EGF92331.1 methionine-R-sulfoxide reductase [Asticcacaulis biprosthecium C19]
MTKSALGFDLTPPSPAQIQDLAARLDPEARRILLNHGTEAPFCGRFDEYEDEGTYVCNLCDLPLFSSRAKFHSGSGWPSFYQSVDKDHIRYLRDVSHGMVRTEIRCGRCDSHLGHVFEDGPRPTGQRYCLNSVAMEFVPEGEPLTDRLHRGAPEGEPIKAG